MVHWWDLGHHARSILPDSSQPDRLSCLHGVRSLMTIWVMSFHSLCIGGIFLPKQQFVDLLWYNNPILQPAMRGFGAVDVFFLLTGLLIALPVFTDQRDISLKDFWWRRYVRIMPGYAAALLIHTQILFRNNAFYPLALLNTPGMAQFVHSVDPNATHVSTGCDLSIYNLLFINNNLPFGGCMAWTWSLAVQFQFYILFPLVLKWTGRQSRLLYFSLGSVILSLVIRVFVWYTFNLESFRFWRWSAHMFDSTEIDPFFLFLKYWYMPFTIRGATMFLGVVIAYYTVNKQLIEFMKQRPVLHRTCLIASFAVFIAFIVVRSTSLWVILLIYVSGPLFNASLFYMLWSMINSAELGDELIGRCRKLLEWRGWYPISVLSYGAYLVHFSVMQKMFNTVFFPASPNNTYFIFTAVINIILSFMLALVLYVFIQEPAAILMNPSRFSLFRKAESKKE